MINSLNNHCWVPGWKSENQSTLNLPKLWEFDTGSFLRNAVYLLQFCAAGWKLRYSATDISDVTEQSFPVHNCWSADFWITLSKCFCENLMINRRKFPEKKFPEHFRKKNRKFSGNLSAFTSFSVGLSYHTAIVCFVVVMWCFTVEPELFSSGDVGGSADADVRDVVCRVWQVHECWAPSVHHAGISMLELAWDTDWLGAVANQEVGKASDQEDDWACVS